jgi:hypothetical protein
VKGSGRDLILWYYPRICLEGLRIYMKALSQNRRSPGRDVNPGFPENESGMLATPPQRPTGNIYEDR